MDFDKLFKKKAFENIESETTNAFKDLAEKTKNKSFNETVDLIVEFSKNMPKGKKISAEEKNAMISAMLESMSQNDKTKFKEILQFYCI